MHVSKKDRFVYPAYTHEKCSSPLQKLQTHDKAENNSWSLDSGQPKFANADEIPPVFRHYVRIIFLLLIVLL